jgi:excinuclease ABC subunit A
VTPTEAPRGYIHIRGASEHNLHDVDVSVPRDALVAFTGISGSGKSSLVFATIYAEAQRRYFESVAPYARRLIDQLDAPKVGEITGLPPAVALRQQRGNVSSRSSVGTVTTMSNLVRLLFSRAGTYPPGASTVLHADRFSPNTSEGACRECGGTGKAHVMTEDTLVPDPSLTIRQKAVAAWPGAFLGQNFRDILIVLGHPVDTPWRDLPQDLRDWILFTEEQPVVSIDRATAAVDSGPRYNGTFMSAERYVRNTMANSKSAAMREKMLRYVTTSECPSCGGARLRPDALAVTFAGASIAELSELPLDALADVLAPTAAIEHPAPAMKSVSSGECTEVAVRIARDLVDRIDVLRELGLGYLSLGRSATTLSPGELQRLRLATQLRAGLFGVLYVLDEPSAGLHPADTERLVSVLEALHAAGNSLFIVEHDMAVVRQADWVVDVGPGAGENGGHVLYSGPVEGLVASTESVTARHLFPAAVPVQRTRRTPELWLRLRNIQRHNLIGLDVDVPLGVMTVVTGVSGSGKSTLVSQVLAGIVASHLGSAPNDDDDDDEPGDIHADSEGLERIDRLVVVDQKPIGRTPRSNLATYTGLFDSVRKAFADTAGARERGWGPGRFSFNVDGGRCETCSGEGFVAVELVFLPGTYASCPTCGGARYNAETLDIRWRDMTVADVLGLAVSDAAVVLAELPAAARSLATLVDVGLGYLRLGQPATELSGGEAQRIKLASELQRVRRGDCLYVLDEPTSGLHPADVEDLRRHLHRLVDAGNTVVAVEHHIDVIADADWVIDLGPGGGDRGGRIVVAGTPDRVAREPESRTAPHLARHLSPTVSQVGTIGRPATPIR